MTDEALSRQFEQAMRASCEEAAESGYLPKRFLARLQREGGVAYAKKLVHSPVLQSGLRRLAAMRRLDLSIEHLVASDRFRGLFTKADVEAARGRLKLAMEGVGTAPADDGEDAFEPGTGASVEKRGAATPPPDEWDNALELAASDLGDAMRHWRAAGLPPPVVGYELTDGAGEVVAEAELVAGGPGGRADARWGEMRSAFRSRRLGGPYGPRGEYRRCGGVGAGAGVRLGLNGRDGRESQSRRT